MIAYQLKCGNGHEFEAWFKDGATYDAQARCGDISCPHCGDVDIAKAPMAPNLGRGVGDGGQGDPEARARELAQRILDAVGKLREHVEETCENVGAKFAEEARRIHYGETEERGIYGVASPDEAQEMKDEGIEFYRLPGSTGRRQS